MAVLDDATFGAATPVAPKLVSPADPAARWIGANGGLAFFAYCTNYLIDLKRAVILDVEATTAVRQAEVTAQQRMIDRTQERFGLWPGRLAADAAYGSAENLAWMVSSALSRPHGHCHRDYFKPDFFNDIGAASPSAIVRATDRSSP